MFNEQVPASVLFLTDGLARTVQVGAMKITLRRTTPRVMATAGRLSGLLIQAFRYLGKENVTPARLDQLRHSLPAVERESLVRDIKYAPAWIHRHFRELARPEEG